MVGLSKKQKQIYEKMLSDPERVWAVEDFSSLIFGPIPPKSWRVYLLEQMRWICARTQKFERPVFRSSKAGRGNKAEFSLKYKGEVQ